MKTALHKKARGFTIVEVLIVLSIASLIMLVVFLAVPQLQRSSRNNQRNGDAYKVLSAVNECLSNNNGVLSACLHVGAAGTFDTNTSCSPSCGPILTPSGGSLDASKLQQLTTVNIYAPVSPAAGPVLSDNTSAYVYGGYTCNPDNTATNTNVGANQFVVLYNRESGGGTNIAACSNP